MSPPKGVGLDQRHRKGIVPAWRPHTVNPRRKKTQSQRISPLKRGKTTALLGRAADTNGPNLSHNSLRIEHSLAPVCGRQTEGKNAALRGAPHQFQACAQMPGKLKTDG